MVYYIINLPNHRIELDELKFNKLSVIEIVVVQGDGTILLSVVYNTSDQVFLHISASEHHK